MTGNITQTASAVKVELQKLLKKVLSWDNARPNDWDQCGFHTLRWCNKLIALDFKELLYRLDSIRINVSDASIYMSCFAIHAQFSKRNGTYSVVDAAGLTEWVKPGEIWHLSFKIWTLRNRTKLCKSSVFHENINTVELRSFYAKMFLFFCVQAHLRFGNAYYFWASWENF